MLRNDVCVFDCIVLAQSYASSGNEAEARRLGQASLGISLAGILVLVILTIIFVVIAMA